jgi:type IV pilus biogenesis protein CpaD/CtpE
MKSLLAAIAIVWLTACASTPPPTAPAALQAMRDHPERLIIVAVANPKAGASVA